MNLAAFLATTPGRLLLALARLAFWSAAGLLAWSLCRRGLTLGDEGYLLSQAADILAGKVPYRDLDLFVTPGAWYLNAAIFSFTGPSVIATRIAAALCLLATMAVTRRIVRATGSGLWGDFAAGLVAIFAVWAWPAWSFSFYSPWAVLASLTALACTLEWMRSRRSAWLVAGGVSLGLAIAFKQNYGVFAAVGCTMAMMLDEIATATPTTAPRETARRCLRSVLFVAAGGALVLLPLVAWLAQQGALPAAFESLVLRPFQGFTDAHSIRYLRFGDLWRRTQIWTSGGLTYMAVPVTATAVRSAWLSPAISLVELLHVGLYWVPAFAFAGLGLQGFRRLRHNPTRVERSLLAITVFAAACFLGVFPRADFNHLINVYQPVLAMLAAAAAVHFGSGRWRMGTARRAAAGLAMFSFLCFAGVAAVWMNELRKIYWIPLDAPRAGVLLEPLNAEMLNQEIRLLRSSTAPDEPVFALPGLSMIPFLAERPMPTRYYNYYAVHIGHDAGREAAQEIEDSGARVVLAAYDNFFSDPDGLLTYGLELATYLQRVFQPELTLSIQSQMLLLRRDHPLEALPSTPLWPSCDLRGAGPTGGYLREHLLFRSLYHSYRPAWPGRNQRITVCQVQVPSAARLRLALDLRQPDLAVEPANVRAEAWVLPDHGRPRRLLEHDWPLASEPSGSRPAGPEFVLDLARWEGEVVTILLRSLVEGTIPPRAFDHHGLSVMWNDARIESPDYADAGVFEGEPGTPGSDPPPESDADSDQSR